MTLLLMAAGKGSRYGKLKQFDGLGPQEEFLMEFSIYDALQEGFDHIVVITQEQNVEFLYDHLSSRLPKGIRLNVLSQKVSDLPSGLKFDGERSKPWGTAHAVWTARDVIRSPFVVVNADDYYGKAAYANAARFISTDPGNDSYGIVAYTLKDTLSEYGSVSRGVCEQDGDKLVNVVERTKIALQNGTITDENSGLTFSGDELVSMNFWICSPTVFPAIESAIQDFFKNQDLETGEVYLPFVIQELLEQNKAEVNLLPANSTWFGITYADDKDQAMKYLHTMTSAGAYPSPLWS